MATIQTSIRLFDGMTPVLRSITTALNITVSSFEAMQRASSQSVDTASLQSAREELARASAQLNEIEQSVRAAGQAQQGFNNRIESGRAGAGGLLSQFRGLLSVMGLITAAKKAVELSDSLTQSTARLELLVDDGGSVDALEAKIYRSAQRSSASYLDMMQSVSKIGILAGDAFTSNDELIRFTELMNKNFVVGGASATEQAAAMYQLTQALASGRLQGDEYRSIIENAPLLAQSIEDYMRNVAGMDGTMKDWASQGLLTADVIKNAMFNSAEEVESRFESMPMTWSQVFTMAGNFAIRALDPLLRAINWLANNISIIGPLVLGLGSAFAVFQFAAHWTQIADFATKAYSATLAFLQLGFGVLTGNAAAASSAVLIFNSALLACPLTWIIMVLMVVVGVIYGAVAAFNKLTGSSVSATGIIGAAFAVLIAFLQNTFLIPLYNAFAALVNFIGNVFNDPIAAIKVLFYDLSLDVIGYIRSMAEGIEKLIKSIPGFEVNITSGLDNLYKNLEDARQKVKDESEWVEYVKTMNYIDYGAAAADGYEIASKLFSSDLGKGRQYDDILADTAAIVDNTSGTADALDYAEEDLQYMRDIAEREAVNRFTTAEIRVDVGGISNNVASNMDLDGVVHGLTDRVVEGMMMAAEGVHY